MAFNRRTFTMTIRSLRFLCALSLSASALSIASAAEGHNHSATTVEQGSLVPAKEASPEWLAKARSEYPTEKCLVSDEALAGDMGGPVDFVYKQAGKPDRLVRFCCKDCVKDFKKDPAKYLSDLDAASAAKAPKK